jgi:hypothetical protein
MFGHKHYVPVLKGKRAEFPALEHLKSNQRVTPLIECVPGATCEFIPRKMSAFWPDDRPYFIDAVFVDDEDADEAQADDHHVTKCFEEVAEKEQAAIPVTGTGRSPAYQAAVKSICAEHETGVAFRLVPEDFEDEDELGAALDALSDLVNVSRGNTDLILDLGSVADASAAAVAQTFRSSIELLPHLADWRTLTALSGAFPKSLAPLTRDIWNTAARADWRGWRGLVTSNRQPERLPTYGDYTIAHPDMPPKGRATILAQLRYSTPNVFLIWKGSDIFKHKDGHEQFINICKDLVANRPEYRGAGFSMGDEEIDAKAATGDSPGNAETWRKIGMSHHLETVLEQIASLP